MRPRTSSTEQRPGPGGPGPRGPAGGRRSGRSPRRCPGPILPAAPAAAPSPIPAGPLVVSRRRDIEPATHSYHRVTAFSVRIEGALLRVDKLVLGAYRYSLAKKAAAFPKNSF